MHAVDYSKQLETYFPTAVIYEIAPTDYHQNNASLFKLARLVKGYEHSIGRAASQQELKFIFDRWSSVAEHFWQPELTRDDYYAEFLEAYGYARIGLDENPIDAAVSRAKAAPLPEVEGFTDQRIRLLCAICREMQILMGDSPFFLPTRKLADILGVHWTRVAHWLRGIELIGIIRLADGEVRQRGGSRSPRYHYNPPTRNTVGCVATVPLPLPERHAVTDGNHANDMEAHPSPKMLRSVATVGVIDVDCQCSCHR